MPTSMRSFIGSLILLFSNLYSAPNKGMIDKGLKEFKQDTPENQVEHLNRNGLYFDETVLKSQTEKMDDGKREAFLKSLLEHYDHQLTYSSEFVSHQIEKLDPILREKLILEEIKKQEESFTFSTDFLDHHYKKLSPNEQNELLKVFLGKLKGGEQQALVNTLNKKPSYKDFLMHISEDGCKSIKSQIPPQYVGTTPLISFLNASALSSFFDPKMKRALLNRDHYNQFNPYDQGSLWVEPFGFTTSFHRKGRTRHLKDSTHQLEDNTRHQKGRPRHFDLYTLGLVVGGELTFLERLTLDIALGYSYSSITWKKSPQNDRGSDQAIYFGPSLNYLFTKGHLSFMLVGIGNFYHMKRDLSLFPEIKKQTGEASYQSWDFLSRLEGSFSLGLGYNLYLYPQGRVDYLSAFQLKGSEKIEKDLYVNFDGLYESFLLSKVGIELTHEKFQPGFGFLIPSLTSGVKCSIPLTFGSYRSKLESCGEENKIEYGSWTQYFFGAGVSLTHVRGAYLTLNYELTVGYHAPQQKIKFRASWHW